MISHITYAPPRWTMLTACLKEENKAAAAAAVILLQAPVDQKNKSFDEPNFMVRFANDSR